MSKDATQSFIDAKARPNINILRVASAVQDGETVSIGGVVFEADFSSTPAITSGRQRVDLSTSSAAAAARVGTFANNPANNDTVGIAGVTYTFKDALSTGPAVANEVLIGADLTATRNNLVAAVNAANGAGSTYGTGTVANPSVTAVATSTDAITVTARVKGTVGNSIALAESSSHFSWASSATTLAGGADATAGEFTTALTTVINAVDCGGSAVRIGANEVLFIERGERANPLAYGETLGGSNNAWAAAAGFGGQLKPLSIPDMCLITRVPTATEVALGNLHTFLNFTPQSVLVQVRTTSTGAIRAWDGTAVITGNRITLAGGTTPLATTETVTIFAAQ